jgi:hypothetical protein
MIHRAKDYAAIFHSFRRLVFLHYEKHGYGKTIEFIQNSRALPHIKAGLSAEVLFYDRYFKKFRLEPLLDARVKADFSGDKDGKFVNFDVTTNIRYKNIDDYLDVVQKRGKPYEIVLTDLKNEDFQFLPLKFPICPKCGKFSHYIIYLEPPSTSFYLTMNTSDQQTLVQYCEKCKYFKNVDTYTYEVHSIGQGIEEMSSQREMDSSPVYSNRQIEEYRETASVRVRKFFEKTSDFIISGIAENDYVATDPRDGSGYYAGLLHWKHPLAKDLSKYIDVFSGEPEIPAWAAKKMFEDFRCKVCGNSSLKLDRKKLELVCRHCSTVYDVSKMIHTHGHEVKRVEKLE